MTALRAARRGRRTRGEAIGALALGAAVLLGGCSGDGDDDPTAQTLPTEDPAGGDAGDGGFGLGGGAGNGAATAGTGDELPGAGQAGEVDETPLSGADRPLPGADPVEVQDLDDREALVVESPADAPINAASEYLVFTELFGSGSSPGSGGYAGVQLIRFDAPNSFAGQVDFYDERWIGELDTCFTRELGASGGDGAGDDDDPLQVSGGETLLISTPAGTFGEIPRVVEPGNVFYDADGTLPGPVPAGATLSIPGDDFPVVADYPLPDLPPVPVRLSPTDGEALTTETEYAWEPDDAGGFFKIDFLSSSDDGLLGFPVTCIVRDDGAFELTDEAIDALVAAPGTVTVRFSRVAALIELRDDIVFFTANELAE